MDAKNEAKDETKDAAEMDPPPGMAERDGERNAGGLSSANAGTEAATNAHHAEDAANRDQQANPTQAAPLNDAARVDSALGRYTFTRSPSPAEGKHPMAGVLRRSSTAQSGLGLAHRLSGASLSRHDSNLGLKRSSSRSSLNLKYQGMDGGVIEMGSPKPPKPEQRNRRGSFTAQASSVISEEILDHDRLPRRLSSIESISNQAKSASPPAPALPDIKKMPPLSHGATVGSAVNDTGASYKLGGVKSGFQLATSSVRRSSFGSMTASLESARHMNPIKRIRDSSSAKTATNLLTQRAKLRSEDANKLQREIFVTGAIQVEDSSLLNAGPQLGHTASAMGNLQGFASHAERAAERNRLSALQRRVNRIHSVADPVNFYDVVNAEAEPQSSTTDVSDRLAGKITESIHFQRFILFCIFLNTVLSVLYTNPYFQENYGRLIDQADSVFLTIYFLELALKMKFQKQGFWYDNWNLFDLFLILVSVAGTVVRDIGSRQTVGGNGLKFLRVMRAFRTLRILGALRNLQIVVNTFLKSLLELTNIIAMILLLMFMFSILGLQLFELLVPQYFGSLMLSFQSLFILITQDGWVTIWSAIEQASRETEVSPMIEFINHAYFILFIVIGAWVFINIISGVTVTNWQLYVQEMKQLEEARFHKIESNSLRGSKYLQEARAVSQENVSAGAWAKQVPLSSAVNLGRISIQKLENYMLVIAALEKNLKEYQGLKRNLYKHLAVVQRTNMLMEVPEVGEDGDENDDDEEFYDGDVLSMLQTVRGPLIAKERGSESLLGSIMNASSHK